MSKAFTPMSLASERNDETEKLIDDVKQQIRQLNINGYTQGRVYFEGAGDFKAVHKYFTDNGFKLSAPSGDDNYKVANSSWWCNWVIDEADDQ